MEIEVKPIPLVPDAFRVMISQGNRSSYRDFPDFAAAFGALLQEWQAERSEPHTEPVEAMLMVAQDGADRVYVKNLVHINEQGRATFHLDLDFHSILTKLFPAPGLVLTAVVTGILRKRYVPVDLWPTVASWTDYQRWVVNWNTWLPYLPPVPVNETTLFLEAVQHACEGDPSYQCAPAAWREQFPDAPEPYAQADPDYAPHPPSPPAVQPDALERKVEEILARRQILLSAWSNLNEHGEAKRWLINWDRWMDFTTEPVRSPTSFLVRVVRNACNGQVSFRKPPPKWLDAHPDAPEPYAALVAENGGHHGE